MWRSGTGGRLVIVTGVLCALMAGGCAYPRSSGIDPTGEHLFAPPPPVVVVPAAPVAAPAAPVAVPVAPVAVNRSPEYFFEQPLGRLPWDDVAVELHPRETVAPVGSEVVLVAGVCGPDGHLRTNRRLEWSIDPGSVGQFVAVGETGLVDLLVGDFNFPRKITNTFAIGSTLRANLRLNRGTCRPEENVYVRRGQGWISLTSPIEGTSNVTVVAPEVYTWEARLRAAKIHWVDAQWRFPPPAINPAGSRHVFITTVTRQSNQTPCERWLVRYEILDGPPAGFAPNGATVAEVPTGPTGQACVEIFEKEPRHGTNKIGIQVIRPGDLPGVGGQRLVVGTGATMKTWTAADLAVKISGPPAATPGATMTYRIEICNPGDLPAKDVVAVAGVPDGLSYLGSSPPAEAAGPQLRWRLGELGPRQRRTIDVSFRAEKPGSVTICCDVTAAGGLKVADCATSTIAIAAGTIDVRIVGPTQATVGSQAAFQITVTNRGPTPATGLVIKDRLDAGLEAAIVDQPSTIKRALGTLGPGASQPVNLTLRVAKAGRLCQTVEVTGQNVAPASAQACLMAVGGGTPGATTPGVVPPVGGEKTKPGPAITTSPLSVKKIGPKQRTVGETAEFTIEITNIGTAELRNLKVLDRYDAALRPTMATDGYRLEEGGSLAWTIDRLPVDKPTTLGVHCLCQTAAASACNRVIVTTAEGGKAESEACLEIRAAPPPVTPPVTPPPVTPPPAKPSGLTLSVVGLSNPVAVGKELTYEIRVKNEGTEPHKQISVTATVPEGMLPDPLGTVGPEATKYAIEQQAVRFEPVAELRPGGLLVYRVRVQAKKAGQFRLRVEVAIPAIAKPITQESQPTEVF